MISFVSFLITLNLFFFYFFENFSRLIGLYDKPDGIRKVHKKKVPCIGGFFFLINLAVIVLFLNFFNIESFNSFLSIKQFNIFFFFSFLFFIIGYLDDRFNLNPNIKLISFAILLYLFLFFFPDWIIKNLNFSFYTKSINIQEISYFFTILAFLLFINSFNMFDGINLQSVSYSIFILIIFYIKSNFNLFYFFLIFPLLIFLYLNFKSKCFLGDNGTLILSFVFSFLFIDFHNNKRLLFADEIFLIMLIPGLDMLRLFITRIIKGYNPFHPDRNHIHHLLVKKFGNNFSLIFLLCLIFLPNILNQFYSVTFFLIILSICFYFYLIMVCKKKIIL
jgi:UDP-GlcNAc:undecaprenyl-phosphate GlcNAc-1-phosphate transferase